MSHFYVTCWTLRYIEEGQLESEGDVLMVSSQDEILGEHMLYLYIVMYADYVDTVCYDMFFSIKIVSTPD